MILVLSSLLLAAPAAYYLPDDVATSSKLFAETSSKMAPRFEAAQGEVAKVSGAIGDLDLGVSLLGKSAPEGMVEWSAQTRRNLTGQYLRLSRLLSRMQDDYSGEFSKAMERALASVGKGYDLKTCGNTGVMAQFHRNSCSGENLNGPLAVAMDQDAMLQKALTEIQAVEWPTIQVEPKAWASVPLTGKERYVQFSTLAHAFLQERLDAREGELDAALTPLEDKLSAKDAAAIEQAGKLKDQWRTNLGEDGQKWMAVLTDALSHTKGAPASVGLCGNPAYLGGCEGEDVTGAVIELLKENKKFLKSTSRI